MTQLDEEETAGDPRDCWRSQAITNRLGDLQQSPGFPTISGISSNLWDLQQSQSSGTNRGAIGHCPIITGFTIRWHGVTSHHVTHQTFPSSTRYERIHFFPNIS
eukprot:1370238-Amorphochlora_amoeboformis.AAC.1